MDMYMSSLRAVMAAWLNASHINGVGMNRSARGGVHIALSGPGTCFQQFLTSNTTLDV